MSTKRKAPVKLAAPAVKPSAIPATRSTIDESKASVVGADVVENSQGDPIEISSEADSEDVSDEEVINKEQKSSQSSKANGKAVNGKHRQVNKSEADGDSDKEASPSFGELMRNNEAIDVTALMQQQQDASVAGALQPARTAIVPPSSQSLTTVLTQALKTDDTELLESCLHTTDLTTIRNTAERIDSALAGVLLNKLAARLYRRPGRAGNLMTWVSYTLVAHGGSLASQPKVVHSLNGLQKVLAERSKGLSSLLALKGKLDLLESQMDLRRRMQQGPKIDEDEDEDENVIWVEGQHANGMRSRRRHDDEDGGDDEDEDDTFMANGAIGDSDDEEEASEDGYDAALGSDVAEESVDEDEVDHEDVDESGEDEESDGEAAPPAKVQKVGKAFKRR